MQKHRISTNLGKDQKINVELKQDFDVLEILSLKFSQEQISKKHNKLSQSFLKENYDAEKKL